MTPAACRRAAAVTDADVMGRALVHIPKPAPYFAPYLPAASDHLALTARLTSEPGRRLARPCVPTEHNSTSARPHSESHIFRSTHFRSAEYSLPQATTVDRPVPMPPGTAPRLASSFVAQLNRLAQGIGRRSRAPDVLNKVKLVEPPEFVVVGREGADHEPLHRVRLSLQYQLRKEGELERVHREAIEGRGKSVKEAREAAARQALVALDEQSKSLVLEDRPRKNYDNTTACSGTKHDPPLSTTTAPTAAQPHIPKIAGKCKAPSEKNATSKLYEALEAGSSEAWEGLSSLKVAELKPLAKEVGVPRYYRLTKPELVYYIRQHFRRRYAENAAPSIQ